MPTFQNLLLKYMAEKKAKVNPMATAIKINRATLINWRTGKHQPDNRDHVLAAAHYLRLSKLETNELLVVVGFPEQEDVFVNTLFLALPHYPVTLLLTQADWSELPYHEALAILFAKAQKIYSQNNVLHIKPPANLNADINRYFSKLGKQCRFSGVDDGDSFESALEDRLAFREPLFLLVSRFEQGADSPREQLAAIIRSVSATAPHFHVILCGGEKLADLKYKEGALSLLNSADVKYWQELSCSDVDALINY